MATREDLAIDQHRQIEFLVDRRAFFDVEPVDLLAFRSGLMRHQRRAENARRFGLHVVDRFHDLDAAGLAASAGVNLRLHHPHRPAKLLRAADRLVDRECRKAARHRHAEFSQNRLGLIFVDIHDDVPRAFRRRSAVRASWPDLYHAGGQTQRWQRSYFARLGAIFLQASTRVSTAPTDLSNIVRSAELSSISTMRSTPRAPITTGTPT